MIAEQGLKETVITATAEALDAHELIKIRMRGADRPERHQLLDSLCSQTQAQLVGQTGSTALLFKRNSQKSRIALPHR